MRLLAEPESRGSEIYKHLAPPERKHLAPPERKTSCSSGAKNISLLRSEAEVAPWPYR